MTIDGYQQHLFLKHRARLRLAKPKVDGQIDDVVLGPERRSVAAFRLLRWAAVAATCALLWWYRVSHSGVPTPVDVMAMLGLPVGAFALIAVIAAAFDLIAPRKIPHLRVHVHFVGREPARACVLHDGRIGQESLSPTVEAITKEMKVRVTVLRTDAPIDEHRTTTCKC